MALTLTATLFILLICLFSTEVASQSVTVDHVTTTSVTLHWLKEGAWTDVVTFEVTILTNEHPFCQKSHTCFLTESCTFNTADHCSMLPPCANVKAIVSGEEHTVPTVTVQTAPEAVSSLTVTGDGPYNMITWTNPTDGSPCLTDTVAKVTYGGYYDYNVTLSPNETSISVPLCNKGSGMVEVQARGGDGESAIQTATLRRMSGDDAVSISSCPTEGCTDMTVEWDYKPVCSEVTHFEVTIKQGSNTTVITAHLDNTTVSFDDLELDTLYETCVSALDFKDKLMASTCTTCGTYPEVVENLMAVNTTDSTALFQWQPPLCQVKDDIEYSVSYSKPGTTTPEPLDTTSTTTFLLTGLNPTTTYTFCVLVRHSGDEEDPKHRAECTTAFTRPSAPRIVEVTVYKGTSLFVTWPSPVFTPNIRYLVAWGEDLEYSNYTEYRSYTITGYNGTQWPSRVCVLAESLDPFGVRSEWACQGGPYAEFGTNKPDHTAMIASVSVSAALAVLLSLALFIIAKRTERTPRHT